MIHNKKELRYYLKEDEKRYSVMGIPTIKDWILHNEKWYIHRYLVALRHVEYHQNTGKKGLLFLFWFLRYKRLGFKLRITISPNTCGPGLVIFHVGDMIWVKSSARIGRHCSLRPGVVIGRKHFENASEMPVKVGDNCNFGLGVKVFGKVNIGDNVIIGANSVVTHDIPDNAVAAGCPARIIKKD